MYNPEHSFKSFNSISKSNDDNSSIMTNTINPNIAKLSFRVKFETKYGQSLYIIGSIEELGEWDPSKAVPMATSKDIYPTWKITKEFTCPLGMEIFYKYLVKEGNNIYWEELNNNKNQNRRIVIQSPGNLIIFDEKSNNISKIKTMAYYPVNSNAGNASNTTNKINHMLSNLSFNTGNGIVNYNNNNNNNLLSSNLYMASYQSLSSYQSKSIDFSTWRLTEGENEDNNYFNNLSSNTYEFVNEEENINNNIDQNLEMLDLCQNIQQDDKIIIVTTFLPILIEKKENPNNIINSDNANISENTQNINIKPNLTIYDDKLVNLYLYSLKLRNACEVYWVGMLRGLEEYPEKVQYEISESLENQKIYVVMPSKKELQNFQIYVNHILYPLFNNLEIDINSNIYLNPENYYTYFLAVNKNFAEIINSCLNDTSKMVFINDIDLAFVPIYLLSKNIKANISLFVHSNFPDYDTLSLMNSNKDLLKSLLLCNSLGFHSFSQAKNFFNAIKIYFNCNYKARFDGLFFVEYIKREIPIFIRNPNLEIDFIKSLMKNLDIKESNNTDNNNRNKIINLLSFDSINNVCGILNKLNIFLEINICKYLDYKYKLQIIVVKDNFTNKYINEENEKNEKIINNNIKIINDKLGDDFNNLFKISFVNIISIKEQFNYFINTDIFLFNDINLWNGTRTLMQEFIIIQNEIILNKNKIKENEKIDNIKLLKYNMNGDINYNKSKINNKIIGLIVSENMVVPEGLKLITKANFSDLENIKKVLQSIITKSEEEKIKIMNNDYNQIRKNSTTLWIKDFLCELKKTMINSKNKVRSKIGYGLDFSYYQISKKLRPLTIEKIPPSFRASSTKLFLLDLDSIITNYSYLDKNENEININLNNIDNKKSNINNINNSFIDNNEKIINILSNLSKDKNIIIYLITNKSKEVFKELKLNSINFGYVAEEGFIIKPYGEENFKNNFRSDNNWKNSLIQLFKNFSKKIGEGIIKEKEYSICWSYKNNENNIGFIIGEELKFLIENAIDKAKFDIILDKNILEVKMKDFNKYQYIFEIIQKIVNENKNFNFIFGLNNNDKYGEGFFEYLYSMEREFKEKKRTMNLFTFVIGKKTTKANYYFKDITNLIEIFKVFEIKK